MPGPRRWRGCEDHGVDYVFGLPGTESLSKKVDETADAVDPPSAPSTTRMWCAVTRRGTEPNPGTENAAP